MEAGLEVVESATVAEGAITCVAALPGFGFLTGHVRSLVAWRDVHTRGWACKLVGAVLAVVVRGNGSVVSASGSGIVVTAEGAIVNTVTDSTRPKVSCLAVHPTDDDVLASGSWDCTTTVWNIREGGVPLWVCGGHTKFINSVAFLADGTLMTGSNDFKVKLWGADGLCTASLPQWAYVNCIAPLPGGPVFATVDIGATTVNQLRWWRGVEECVATSETEATVCGMAPLREGHLAVATVRGLEVFSSHHHGAVAVRRHPTPSRQAGVAQLDDGTLVAVSGTSLAVYRLYRVTRLKAIEIMAVAWDGRGPPPGSPLAHALRLRRLCRVRGEDDVGMPLELVEPFARDVVRFL